MNRRFRTVMMAIACLAVAMTLVDCAAILKRPALTQQQRQLNLESFEYVWTTIRDKHFDPELGGLDWQAIHDELRPKVQQARTMSEARKVMHDMISRLELTHFSIIPAEVYQDMNQPGEKGAYDGVTGIDLRIIDGHALVTRVEQDSPAAEAGVKTGWEIIRISEDDVVSKLQPIAKEFDGKTYKDLVLAYAVKSRLSGKIGDPVVVQFRDGADQTVELNILLIEKKGKRFQIGHLPPLYVWIDVDSIDQNIGYIAFNGFLDPINVMPAFNNAMKSFMDADGLIIDIRGNPGGVGDMAMGMAGWLVAEKNRRLGTLYMRDNELKVVVNPRATTYSGPVAILVDGLSTSCSEIFSGGLKDLGRACIFGSRTGGAALPSIIEKLPNGDGFQYAFANYRSEGGEVLEGAGVTPDVEVVPTQEALLQGRDLVLETAVAWIRSQK